MRRLALIAVPTFALLVAAPFAGAAPAAAPAASAPASRASVEKLFGLMNLDQTIAQSLARMESMTRQSISGMPQARNLAPEQRARFDAGMAQVDAMLRDDMSWARLEPEFARIYGSTFTQSEIDGQIAFYSTPAGQAVITKTPQLTERSMAAIQAHMQALAPRIQATMQQAMKPADAASAAQ